MQQLLLALPIVVPVIFWAVCQCLEYLTAAVAAQTIARQA